MWKLQCRNKYLLISQSRFIDVPCLCPFCAGQIGNEIRYFYFLRFCWRKANICWKYSCLFKLPNTFTRYKIYWTQNIKMIWRKLKNDLLGYCIHKLLMKVYFISFFYYILFFYMTIWSVKSVYIYWDLYFAHCIIALWCFVLILFIEICVSIFKNSVFQIEVWSLWHNIRSTKVDKISFFK